MQKNDSFLIEIGAAFILLRKVMKADLFLCGLFSLAVLIAPACSGQAVTASTRWVATWGAAPLPRTLSADDHSFSDVTLWQTVHTSLGGNAIRLQFTNEFGSDALHIAKATVALSGRAVPPAHTSGVVLPVTFHGRSEVVIPAGARMVSDPVDLRLAAGADLLVTMYVPSQTMHVLSFHSDAQQSNYIAAGNVSGQPDAAHSRRITSWFFLRDVDVATTDRAAGAVAAFGDSITDGARSTIDQNQRWPDLLSGRLRANPGTANLAVVNAGIGGNRILQDAVSTCALARFDRDVLAQSGVRYVIVLEGINDITHINKRDGRDEQATATDLIAALEQLALRAHAGGLKIYAATIIPYGGTRGYMDEGEQMRQDVNQWIRTNRVFDGFVDFDKVVRDPQHPTRMLPEDDSGDHLHPGDAGYRAMANAIDLSWFVL